MAKQERSPVETLEQGNVYFFYRPRVGEDEPEARADVARLYMVLSPRAGGRHRACVIGRQELPDPARRGRAKLWGFIDGVEREPRKIAEALRGATYETKTRGQRRQPAARPVGEGVYRIVRHDDHTHLAYALELPAEPGEVQDTFNIREEASYVLSVRNPEVPAPPGAGLGSRQRADYPARLMEVFRGRRFAFADPPELLDYEGAEILLMAAGEDVKDELGIELRPEDEDESSADVLKELRLRKQEHPTEPLLEGRWA